MVWAVVSTVLLQFAVIYLPFMQRIFDTQALGVRDLIITLGASLFVLIFVEIWKAIMRSRAKTV